MPVDLRAIIKFEAEESKHHFFLSPMVPIIFINITLNYKVWLKTILQIILLYKYTFR